MLEQDARKKAIEMIEDRGRVFCPLIKERCSISCECYNMPEVRNNWDPMDAETILEKDSWIVSNGYCTCHALKGGESFNI